VVQSRVFVRLDGSCLFDSLGLLRLGLLAGWSADLGVCKGATGCLGVAGRLVVFIHLAVFAVDAWVSMVGFDFIASKYCAHFRGFFCGVHCDSSRFVFHCDADGTWNGDWMGGGKKSRCCVARGSFGISPTLVVSG